MLYKPAPQFSSQSGGCPCCAVWVCVYVCAVGNVPTVQHFLPHTCTIHIPYNTLNTTHHCFLITGMQPSHHQDPLHTTHTQASTSTATHTTSPQQPQHSSAATHQYQHQQHQQQHQQPLMWAQPHIQRTRVQPPLIISVSEPVKREQSGMFGLKGGCLCV